MFLLQNANWKEAEPTCNISFWIQLHINKNDESLPPLQGDLKKSQLKSKCCR